MLNTFLKSNSNKYIFYSRIQTLIWHSNGLVLPQQLQRDAVNVLLDVLNHLNNSKNLLIIDFKNVIAIDDHALDTFFDLVNTYKLEILFIDYSKVEEDLINYLNRYKEKRLQFKESKGLILFNSSFKPKSYLFYEKLISKIQAEFINDSIQSCFIKHPKQFRLPSTYLKTNGEYDSAKIISSPKRFLWVTLFLNDLIEDIKKVVFLDAPGKKIKLLAVSLKAAPFAAALGLLSKIQFSTIDHLGPRHKLFDVDFLEYHESNVKYVYVGDFMAGGTEIKIAQTYSQINNCSLSNGIVIATYLDTKDYLDFNIKSLANMQRLNKGYKITF